MGTSIHLTRSGGLAGLEMVASVDVDKLPASTASKVRSALAGLTDDPPPAPPRRRSRSAAPPPGADRYQYDLVVETGGKRRKITAHDGTLSPELQALVDELMPFAGPQ